MTTCPQKIKLWAKADGEFACRRPVDGHTQHVASGLIAGQTIHWYDGDRRNFTGEFNACDQSTCILPAGHHGRHAS